MATIAEAPQDRARELRVLDGALTAALDGAGALVILAGPAGIGKTRLLDEAAARAAARGLTVLRARGSELERDVPHGVARRLLEGPVSRAAPGQRAALLAGAARHAAPALDLVADPGESVDAHAVRHGLYWLLANLAATRPVLVAVDDAQWADVPSLRFLAHLAARLEDAAVALVVALRDDAGPPAPALDAILSEPHGERLEPAPLGEEAISLLVARRLDATPEPEFVAAVREQTGGNPFLLDALLTELAEARVAPLHGRAGDVRALVPRRVGEAVRRRLAPLGDDAAALAAAVAILDDDAPPAAAGRLAALDAEVAARAAVDLAAAGLFRDATRPAFAHPLLRAAVQEQMPALARARAHARAARVLASLGAGPDAVAAQLVAAGHGDGDPWAVDQVLAAAAAARRRGAPDAAAALLRRALAEPPGPDARPAVLHELGGAELVGFAPEAAEHLAEAVLLAADPVRRGDASLALAVSHYYAGRHGDAVDALLAALDDVGDAPALRERRLRLEAFLAVAGRYDLRTEAGVRGRVRRLAGTMSGATAGERLVIAVAALEEPRTARDLARGAALAARADDELPWPDPSGGVGNVAMLLHAARPAEAAALAERLLAAARRSGSPVRYATALTARGTVAADVGGLRDAEADLRDAVAALGLARVMPVAGSLVQVLVERGSLGEAEAVLAEHGLDGELAEQMLLNPVLFARGMLRAAQGRHAEAASDLLELGRRHARWEMRRPSPPWRSAAARALMATGDSEQAGRLAAEELELARSWGTVRAEAVALRAVALCGPTDAAAERLAAAATLLEDTPWRLEVAHTAIELGAALRRAGLRREARAALERALDGAHACGAEPLAARAEEELRSTGARPRRRAISGLEALTPTELRVATLAAAGRSNRELAQELFVTVATVETHLTRVYRKLDLSGRAGLAAALESRS